MVQREIGISVVMRDNLTKVSKTITQSTQRMKNGFNTLKQEIDGTSGMVLKTKETFKPFTNAQRRANAGFRRFGDALRLTNEEFKETSDGAGRLNKGIKENSTRMGRAGLAVRKATTGFRGFKMELLGVMFFGMAIQRIFKSLIQPALQMTGAIQLLSTVLGIMFLPIGLMVIDFAVALLGWWDNLSESTQKLIQRFVLIGLAVGTFLMMFGAIGLGVGSVIIAFGGLIATLINALPILALIAVGLALFGIALPSVRAGTDDLNTSLEKQEGFFSRLIGWVDGLWEKLLDAEPVQKFLKTMGLTEEQIEKLKNPIKLLKDTITKLWDKIKESEAFKSVKEEIDAIISRFEEFKQRWIWNIWPPIADVLNAFIEKLQLITTLINAFGIGGRFILGKETILGAPGPTTPGGGIGTVNLDITNNVTATSDVDIDNLKDKISIQIKEELDRLIRS